MAGIILKVSPDVLKSKAQEVQTKTGNFEKSWKQLVQVVHNTKGYWVGEASNAHQRQLKDCEDDVEKIIRRLKEHPKDLLAMAGIYEEAEKEAMDIANALPDDVII